VKKFADKFDQGGERLDILVENAAIYANKYDPTEDGWETAFVSLAVHCTRADIDISHRFQVSCLSTPLMALLLLPTMLKTAREHSTVPRLVVVSSEVHYWPQLRSRFARIMPCSRRSEAQNTARPGRHLSPAQSLPQTLYSGTWPSDTSSLSVCANYF
jgi:NAD(P)-dependent dehydrogenase (short-subunit alcohol dehydrogenase family)